VHASSDVVFRRIRVLLAGDSHLQSQLLTSALRRRPEFRVAACAGNPESILQELVASPVDAVLLDPSHDHEACLVAVRRIRLAYPQVPLIMLVEAAAREFVVNAFRSGVRGMFCLTECPFRSLCKCIHCTVQGQVWISHQQLEYLLELVCQVPSLRVVTDAGQQLLTPREGQVVALVSEGLSNRDVSVELGLSEHTIKKYLFRIFDKLGVSNRVELVLYAVHHREARPVEWATSTDN
jgi:DNA-binding NarL/FixJ family response regulator